MMINQMMLCDMTLYHTTVGHKIVLTSHGQSHITFCQMTLSYFASCHRWTPDHKTMINQMMLCDMTLCHTTVAHKIVLSSHGLISHHILSNDIKLLCILSHALS